MFCIIWVRIGKNCCLSSGVSTNRKRDLERNYCEEKKGGGGGDGVKIFELIRGKRKLKKNKNLDLVNTKNYGKKIVPR